MQSWAAPPRCRTPGPEGSGGENSDSLKGGLRRASGLAPHTGTPADSPRGSSDGSGTVAATHVGAPNWVQSGFSLTPAWLSQELGTEPVRGSSLSLLTFLSSAFGSGRATFLEKHCHLGFLQPVPACPLITHLAEGCSKASLECPKGHSCRGWEDRCSEGTRDWKMSSGAHATCSVASMVDRGFYFLGATPVVWLECTWAENLL